MDKILFTIWFFLPAALANSSAVVTAKLPMLRRWNYPLDLNNKYKGKRVLGDHKTIRGLVSGIVVAILVVYLQKEVFTNISMEFKQVNYERVNSYLLGFLLGGGALIGDAVKSFFKRRQDLKPGAMWFPFDQIDYILGSSIFSYFYISLDFTYYLIYLLIGLSAHLLTNFSAYILGLKDVPY